MNLRNISDKDLDQSLVAFAKQEREILTRVLHHLRENERRRLYSAMGYRSLFDYATKRMGYSEHEAARRITAMRLLKELPEVEEKIESGSLNLTTLVLAKRHFRQEEKLIAERKLPLIAERKLPPISKVSKLQLLESLEGQSTRAAEKMVLAVSSDPAALTPDRIKHVTEQKLEVRFLADESLIKKFDILKGLLAHQQTGENLSALLHKVCDIAIAKLNPAQHPSRPQKNNPPKAESKSPAAPLKQRDSKKTRPYIPSKVKRLVWQRANCKCQQCGSQWALQIDHIVPLAKGGTSEAENLRILCRSCNQRAAIEQFVLSKMQPFLRSPVRGYG